MEKKKTTSKKAAKKPVKKAASKPKKETREEKIARETQEKKVQVLKIFEKKGANVSVTCEAANIGRRTFYYWRENDKDFDAACKDIEEALVDFAESMLIEKINGKDLTAIIFYLKTKGKDRGYVERTEQDVKMNPFIEAMQDLPDPPQS
ncbi:MAG: hypothetical protein IKP11_01755 [Paludibacteraceae bacterium]|nr:hypothetical protein [Paludibacteraceae bacterium]